MQFSHNGEVVDFAGLIGMCNFCDQSHVVIQTSENGYTDNPDDD